MYIAPLLAFCFAAQEPGNGLRIEPQKNPRRVAVTAQLPKEVAKKLPAGNLSQDQGARLLRFYLVDEKTGKNGPPIFGRYQRRDLRLIFQPRYLLSYGQTYRSVFEPRPGRRLTADYVVPPRPKTPPAVVTNIYPTAPVLPANNLRFYIHFSKPMLGGKDLFDLVYLEDEKGNKIESPWLMDEIWDVQGQRLLIYIHPGRIKWGLLLRMLFGPVLHPDRRYSLVISPKLRDQNYQQLGKEYRYTFRTSPENRKRIELSKWKIEAPAAGTRQRLQLTTPQPLDRRSMQRYLKVVDASGAAIPGRIEIEKGERGWSFQPKTKWTNEKHTLVIDPKLEDVAGNTPVQAFDFDLNSTPPPRQRLSLEFRPIDK